MKLLNVLADRLHGVLRREAVIGDIDEEMRLHFQMVVEENVERGMPPEEARRAALRSFGNFDKVRDQAWEARGGGAIEAFWQDVRYGARLLARNRGFTAVAVLTLALGIGANTAIFSVVNELLLRPLPFPEAERIVMLWEISPEGVHQNATSVFNFRAWRERSTTFESVAAFADQRLNLTGNGDPEEVAVQFATPELFRVLRVEPILGRGLRPEDARPDTPYVAVLSHGIWQRRFGGDPRMVGRAIMLNGVSCTVAGILPAGFEWHIRQRSRTGSPAEIWMPLRLPTAGPGLHGRYLSAVARLRPGASLASAKAEMKAIQAQLALDAPQNNKGSRSEILPLREQFVGKVRPALLILLGAVGFVLLIACANVANLLLSRAAAREREIVLRTALGARRVRVVRQLLTESLLLAVLGCLFGLAFAWWGLRALVAISPRDLVHLEGVGLDLPVLALTVAISLVTGIVFGLAPALEATRLNLNDTLKEGGKGAGGQGARGHHLRNRTQGALIVAEIALSLVLLAGAGLLVKSFIRLQRVDLGFDPENVLTLVVPLAGDKYSEGRQVVAFFREATERIAALPGVRDVGIVNYLPFYGGLGAGTGFVVEGRPAPPPGEEPTTEVRVADPGYFRAMGIPVLRGRGFTASEAADARRVVLVSESLVRRYFPGENPIGKRITVDMFFEPVPTEIVGIVGDARYESLVDAPKPTVYMTLPDLLYPAMTLVIRTAGDPAEMASTVRRTLRAIDPNQPISGVRTMTEVMAGSVGRARFHALLLGLFAGLATLLAAIGIFGVMNYSVSLRTHEIGLRIALGARPREVLRLILRQGLALTAIGIAIGLAGALALTRVLSGLLFGVGSTDPSTFAAIVLLLAFVALIACYLPARRATRVDPLIALRYD